MVNSIDNLNNATIKNHKNNSIINGNGNKFLESLERNARITSSLKAQNNDLKHKNSVVNSKNGIDLAVNEFVEGFLTEVINDMFEAIPSDDILSGNNEEEIFRSLFVDALIKKANAAKEFNDLPRAIKKDIEKSMVKKADNLVKEPNNLKNKLKGYSHARAEKLKSYRERGAIGSNDNVLSRDVQSNERRKFSISQTYNSKKEL